MKRRIWKIFLFTIILHYFSLLSYANDRDFCFQGEHLIPFQRTELSIKEEKIKIQRLKEGMLTKVQIILESPTATKEAIGFLLHKKDWEEESSLSQNAYIKINGKTVKLELNISDKKDWIYSVSANLKKGENILEYTYLNSGTYEVSDERFFVYDLKGISCWKNQKIENFELIIDIGNEFCKLPYTFWQDKQKINWEMSGEGKMVFINGEDFKIQGRVVIDSGVFVRMKRGFLRYGAKDFSPEVEHFLIFDYANFEGEQSILRIGEFDVLPLETFQTYKLKDKLFEIAFRPEQQKLLNLSPKELEILKAYPYAIAGYDFSEETLRKYFSQFVWYLPSDRRNTGK